MSSTAVPSGPRIASTAPGEAELRHWSAFHAAHEVAAREPHLGRAAPRDHLRDSEPLAARREHEADPGEIDARLLAGRDRSQPHLDRGGASRPAARRPRGCARGVRPRRRTSDARGGRLASAKRPSGPLVASESTGNVEAALSSAPSTEIRAPASGAPLASSRTTPSTRPPASSAASATASASGAGTSSRHLPRRGVARGGDHHRRGARREIVERVAARRVDDGAARLRHEAEGPAPLEHHHRERRYRLPGGRVAHAAAQPASFSELEHDVARAGPNPPGRRRRASLRARGDAVARPVELRRARSGRPRPSPTGPRARRCRRTVRPPMQSRGRPTRARRPSRRRAPSIGAGSRSARCAGPSVIVTRPFRSASQSSRGAAGQKPVLSPLEDRALGRREAKLSRHVRREAIRDRDERSLGRRAGEPHLRAADRVPLGVDDAARDRRRRREVDLDARAPAAPHARRAAPGCGPTPARTAGTRPPRPRRGASVPPRAARSETRRRHRHAPTPPRRRARTSGPRPPRPRRSRSTRRAPRTPPVPARRPPARPPREAGWAGATADDPAPPGRHRSGRPPAAPPSPRSAAACASPTRRRARRARRRRGPPGGRRARGGGVPTWRTYNVASPRSC